MLVATVFLLKCKSIQNSQLLVSEWFLCFVERPSNSTFHAQALCHLVNLIFEEHQIRVSLLAELISGSYPPPRRLIADNCEFYTEISNVKQASGNMRPSYEEKSAKKIEIRA